MSIYNSQSGVYRHYSAEVENVCLILQQMYTGKTPSIKFHQYRPSFIEDDTKDISDFDLFFSGHTVYPTRLCGGQ